MVLEKTFRTHRKPLQIALFASLVQALALFLSPYARADHTLLKEIIVARNQKLYGESLSEGTYRGEEGLLRIGPEAARSLGMNALVDRDYQEAREAFQRAEKFLERARSGMTSTRKEKSSQEYARQIVDSFLSYKRALEAGRQRLMLYRSRLNPQIDDRLNDTIAFQVMDRLLNDCVKRMDNRLREVLALFYNLCHGLPQTEYALNSENIHFVNGVFRQFLFRASGESLDLFDLDRKNRRECGVPHKDWKKALDRQEGQYAGLVEAAIERYGSSTHPIDPLLFLALIKRESGFDPHALSRVGAAGLTQIMPHTALQLGMKNVFKPDYFDRVLHLMERERKMRSEATSVLFRIHPENALETAARARELMQESLMCSQEKEKLLAQYRQALLQNRNDDRFTASQAIDYGFRYFSGLLRDHEGDFSLALASYNAGPHRVKEYQGIPPFSETILFRNKVLEYYREYLRRAMGRP